MIRRRPLIWVVLGGVCVLPLWTQRKFVERKARNVSSPLSLPLQHSPPQAPAMTSCSCWNARSHHNETQGECCERYLVCLHKMGFVLGGELIKDYKLPAESKEIKGDDYTLPVPKKDFRAVIITRNMINSIISGYLYHKSGRECWLDSVGSPWKRPWWAWRENNWNWERNFTYPGSYPARKGRSICKYLEEESEEDGMRVYTEYAMLAYYRLLYGYWERATQVSDDPFYGRVFFQCYEDFLNKDKEISEVQQTIDYLFPGKNSDISLPSRSKERDPTLHSTSHDPTLRTRLRNIIRDLDANVFNNTLAKHQKAFQCGSSFETPAMDETAQ